MRHSLTTRKQSNRRKSSHPEVPMIAIGRIGEVIGKGNRSYKIVDKQEEKRKDRDDISLHKRPRISGYSDATKNTLVSAPGQQTSQLDKRWVTEGFHATREPYARPVLTRLDYRFERSTVGVLKNPRRSILPFSTLAMQLVVESMRDFQLPVKILSRFQPRQPQLQNWRETRKSKQLIDQSFSRASFANV